MELQKLKETLGFTFDELSNLYCYVSKKLAIYLLWYTAIFSGISEFGVKTLWKVTAPSFEDVERRESLT